jgi:hypothetical protein
MIHDPKLGTLSFDESETKVPGYFYEVDLDRIRDERDLLKWVVQLAPKLWVSKAMLEEFIVRVAEIKRFQVYGLR